MLGDFPSPLQHLTGLEGAEALWIKRDDLNAAVFGGNKVRALEFLLGGVTAGDVILTVGGEGSSHVLATAAHAARLGARTVAVCWRHDMNPEAAAVAAEARARCVRVVPAANVVTGLARATLLRVRGRVRYVPLGGSAPLGILGHVNAALELAAQVGAAELPAPTRLVVPLGSGGTAAGLALGLAVAGLETRVVGARVGPRLAVNRARVLRLAGATAAFIRRHTGAPVPTVASSRIEVSHETYGGSYGRPLAAGTAASAMLKHAGGPALDGTYSAKAFAAALATARRSSEPVLFWLTFDARWMGQRRGTGD